MTQRAPSPDGRPGRRTDSTRPPRTRRGGDLAPYPGARARTAAAGAGRSRAASRPAAASATARRRATPSSTASTPATVWACGPEPIDSCTAWPVPIAETVTAAFTAPGAHVVLLDLDTPTAAPADPEAGAVATSGASPVAAARAAVRALGRTADTLAVDARADGPAGSSRPFWADLVTDTHDPAAALAGAPSPPAGTGTPEGVRAPAAGRGALADLVLVSLPARAAESVSLDRLALLAAERLRHGGIFAVYTHSDWTEGRLADPSGAVVAAAQHADLLYLQHIVALQAPVRNGRLRAAPSAAAAAGYERARHRATVRGLPAPHLRAHGDVLVFAQPADPDAPPPGTTPETAAPGDAPRAGDSR